MKKAHILILAYLPYYLNDAANILVTDYTTWAVIDYALRLAILLFLFIMLRRGDLTGDDLQLGMPPLKEFALWTTATLGASMIFLYITEFVLAPYYPAGAIGSVPVDPDAPIFQFDATIGLVLVALSEEVVCRGLTITVLRDRLSLPMLYVVSAALFSLMHWSLSTHTLVDAFVYGLIFVPATLATRSIWPATVTHFFVNFVLYRL